MKANYLKKQMKIAALPNRIRELRKARGWTQGDLAEMIGCTDSQVSLLETGERRLDLEWLSKLSKVFGIPPMELVDKGLSSREVEPVNLSQAHLINTAFGPETVPCYGDVNGSGDDAIIITEGHEIGQVPIHPDQRGVKKPFAMRVFGDSMHPMYRHGQIVYLVSKLPPNKGDGVVIEMKNGEGHIKEFIRRTEKEVICKQYTPEKEKRFNLADVNAIHTVVGTKRI